MQQSEAHQGAGSAAEVFAAFLKLGLTSFGGPIAHLGYFREELVERRRWITEEGYADLVAICQFLPGPASSQVGFAMGLWRGGAWGAAAAFTAFTLPSALLLFAFALGAASLEGPLAAGALHGLKIVAVAIVAQAVWGMARALCPDRPRAAIALGAVALVAALPGAGGQVGAIAAGALAGLALCRGAGAPVAGHVGFPVSRRAGVLALALFFLLLAALPLLAGGGAALALFDSFYRAGALVFGGGHVVLPLLEAGLVRPGFVTPDAFLAGYGAAQAVPGPLFTFSAYLGALAAPGPGHAAGALLALAAIFLPGFLLLVGVLPFWDALRTRPAMQAAMRGGNAAVVGILGAALYDPVFIGAVRGQADFALALAAFLLLTVWKVPAWAVVVFAAAGGAALALV
ncbi:chromate transporter [Maritimibacter sp. 55A14]|uniref:chromate efflux transporter n=1 Tax=Maritimibacter sp. 55A14 TaxID=2174844 RepID=UPI000D6135E3|nr:chromate efflux transporter [Maritimibacter sp. 55A14]PWE33453.1 chromate transporter [Maritimibacter sp. 55A14]